MVFAAVGTGTIKHWLPSDWSRTPTKAWSRVLARWPPIVPGRSVGSGQDGP